MKKRVALLGAVVVLCLVLWSAVGFEPDAAGACSGNTCTTCMVFQCVDAPTGGHCSCEASAQVGQGRSCVAGGGVCIPVN